MSLSARRAWIEMEEDGILSTGAPVALRKESVDRNRLGQSPFLASRVALRKESVDRNICPTRLRPTVATSLSARRAWIEIANNLSMLCSVASLSARRAWIEMFSVREVFANFEVALRKESVDRN